MGQSNIWRQLAIIVFSTNGELVEVIGTNVDVTERKRAEEALRESEAKIRRLVDANIWGSAFGISKAPSSRPMKRFCTWCSTAVKIRLGSLALDRSDAGRVARAGRTRRGGAELTGTFQPFEKEYFRKDGSRVPVLIGGALFEQSRNEGVAFVLDLTERKCAEEALRESEGKFRDYAETASDWFWEIGPDYKFTLLTENAFGSDPADRIGTACWDHALDLETEPEKWRPIQTTLDSRQPFRDFVYCSARRNGLQCM